MRQYSAKRGAKTSPMVSARIPDEILEIWDRVERSLSNNDHWSKKRFWRGFIVALADHDVIGKDHYRWLSDCIEIYKAAE